MKRRTLALMAEYLSRRPKGRVVGLKQVSPGDYVVEVKDIRDGRIHLLCSADDVEAWISSFAEGRCLEVSAARCGICGEIHTDRGLDGEVSQNCLRCQVELVDVLVALASEGDVGL
ncbi:MAG: hypothetical protein M3277_12090 [Actinomycetota bacterium]|nr:hypothetical protein [Actinomycetota bacterium]